MASLSPNLRAIVLMLIATLVFVINDTFLKLVTDDLPAFESLFLRGLTSTFWGVPLVLVTRNWGKIRSVADRWVLARNIAELAAVLCFIVALKNMPLADITALGQTAPMLMLAGAALIFRERIGWVRIGLICVGFFGALLLAQPTAEAASPYAFLGFFLALGTAIRDLVARKVSADIPGPIVAMSAILVVMVGAGAAHFLAETWVTPSLTHWLYLLASGLFLTIGHLCIYLAYRHGATAAVAPFFYMFTVWAVISGLVVFGTLPNALALTGMILILCSGVIIVLLDERRRRLRPVA